MANIRLQAILKKEVDKIAVDYNCDPSIAFIRLMIEGIFGLDEFETDEAITDGGMDKGIDAIFEKEEDGENILYLIQAKYFTQNPDKTIDENSKNLIIEALSNYVLGDYSLKNLNKKLKEKIEIYKERFANGEIDRVGLVFLTNGQKPKKDLISELEKFQSEQEGTIFYEVITEMDLVNILIPSSARHIDQIQLKIVKDSGSGEKTILNLPDVDTIQGKIFKVDVTVLARIVRDNPNIFVSNIRAFQTLKNKVNKKIAETLRNPDLIKEFIYLNNGITIICDDFQIKPSGEVINIRRPSIINGCQTVSTILEVYKEETIPENIGFVLTRIVKTKEEDIKERIIKSSNTQTAIRDRDLISEDEIQKQLEKQFEQLGYYYQRKRGLYLDKSKDKVVDLEKAAQAYLALYLQKPAEAKNKKVEIFRSYYEQIFHRDITAKQLLLSWVLFNKINERIKELRKKIRGIGDDRKSVFGNAVMHLLPLFDEWVIKPQGIILSDIEDNFDLLNKLFIDNINKVIEKLEKIIITIKKKEPDFNPQYFFKSNDSLMKILNTKEGKIDYTLQLHSKNINRIKDLRYYKPEGYSFDGEKFIKISHWNQLFLKLINLYAKKHNLQNGNIGFIDSGSRVLLISNPDDEEKRLRKQLKDGLWLLTNFDSKKLSNFCFKLAGQLELDLKINLRPTRFRIQKKYKKDKKIKKVKN